MNARKTLTLLLFLSLVAISACVPLFSTLDGKEYDCISENNLAVQSSPFTPTTNSYTIPSSDFPTEWVRIQLFRGGTEADNGFFKKPNNAVFPVVPGVSHSYNIWKCTTGSTTGTNSCSDGTPVGSCSSIKPKECVQSGSSIGFVSSCSKCGCSSGICNQYTDECEVSSTTGCNYGGTGYNVGQKVCSSTGKSVYKCISQGNQQLDFSCSPTTSCTAFSTNWQSCCRQECTNGCFSDGSCKSGSIGGDCNSDIDCGANLKCDSQKKCVSPECTSALTTTCPDGTIIVTKNCEDLKYVVTNEQCPPLCGNNKLDSGEVCDGNTLLNGKTCLDFGYTSGTLKCNYLCDYQKDGCSGGSNPNTTSSKTKSVTLTEYYSTSTETLIRDKISCKETSQCQLKKDYTVDCDKSKSEDLYNYFYKQCDTNSGFVNELTRLAGFFGLLNIGGDTTDFCTSYANVRDNVGICLAKSDSTFGKIWDSTLTTVGGLGLPSNYVLLTTIGILLLIGILIINKLGK